jgi:two-component system chemotaxis response regulator CheY
MDTPDEGMVRYDLSGLSVLFLEQHATMRSLMRGVLRELGIRIIQDASTPEDAFSLFCSGDYDLVLTDWAPTLDGMAVLKAIRTDPDSRNPYAPVIVVTAHTEIGRIYSARDLGMTAFLAKPISARTLYSRIRAVIENKRSFIKCDKFFGPDRRNKRADYGGQERRSGDDEVDTAAPQGGSAA